MNDDSRLDCSDAYPEDNSKVKDPMDVFLGGFMEGLRIADEKIDEIIMKSFEEEIPNE